MKIQVNSSCEYIKMYKMLAGYSPYYYYPDIAFPMMLIKKAEDSFVKIYSIHTYNTMKEK